MRYSFQAVVVTLGLCSLSWASAFIPVCDRVPAMREAILKYLPPSSSARATDCHRVTESDLAQIDNFGGVQFPLAGSHRLRAQDLQGLTQLAYLTLTFAQDYASVPASAFSTPVQVADDLFSETPSLESLRIRFTATEYPGKVLSGPLEFSSHAFDGLSGLKNLEIDAASVNLTKEMLAPLTSLLTLRLTELKILPTELTGKVGDTPVTFKLSDLSATSVFSSLSSLRALVVSKNLAPTPASLDLSFDRHFRFVRMNPGKFMMGSPTSETGRDSSEFQHEVTLTKPFEIQTTEVTQSLWEKVMANNPSRDKSPDNPVEQITMDDITGANGFLVKLNQLKQGQGYLYRLPTEAEWEYAARGGTATAYAWGSNTAPATEFGWYSTNGSSHPHPVASLKPNGFGLYDMAGNVWEWVQDRYANLPDYPKVDPLETVGDQGTIRGGGSGNEVSFLRSAQRYGWTQSNWDVGFRLVRTAQ